MFKWIKNYLKKVKAAMEHPQGQMAMFNQFLREPTMENLNKVISPPCLIDNQIAEARKELERTSRQLTSK